MSKRAEAPADRLVLNLLEKVRSDVEKLEALAHAVDELTEGALHGDEVAARRLLSLSSRRSRRSARRSARTRGRRSRS